MPWEDNMRALLFLVIATPSLAASFEDSFDDMFTEDPSTWFSGKDSSESPIDSLLSSENFDQRSQDDTHAITTIEKKDSSESPNDSLPSSENMDTEVTDSFEELSQKEDTDEVTSSCSFVDDEWPKTDVLKGITKKTRTERWTEDEHQELIKHVAQFLKKNRAQKKRPIDWAYIAKKIETRTAKQCRERYKNHNDCILKSRISGEEKNRIVLLHQEHGNKWSHIASLVNGKKTSGLRTANQIKNCISAQKKS
jgi:hypothetical protein